MMGWDVEGSPLLVDNEAKQATFLQLESISL
jgi:hypothetical protein